MSMYLGDFAEDATVYIHFTTNAADGGRESLSATIEEADITILKDGVGMTLDASTITINFEASSMTGAYVVAVDMANDADFTTGSEYAAVLYPNDETVDSQNVVGVIGVWSCENRADFGTLAAINAKPSSTDIMDAIDGGDSTLLTGIANALGNFTGSGVNTVWGFFRALMNKSASTPSDIGGTFDPTTDSVEAIRELGDTSDGKIDTLDTNVDAIKLVTDKLDDTLEDDGGTQRFTQNALEQAPSAGGGGDATLTNQEILLARTAAGVTVRTSSAADSRGDFSTPIVRGDAYNAAAGNAFVVSRATFPAAVWGTGTTAVLKLDGTTVGTVAVSHDGTETITGTISLTTAETEALTESVLVAYEVEFVNGTDQRTLYGNWAIRGSDEA